MNVAKAFGPEYLEGDFPSDNWEDDELDDDGDGLDELDIADHIDARLKVLDAIEKGSALALAGEMAEVAIAALAGSA
jgi:hypothetical protein